MCHMTQLRSSCIPLPGAGVTVALPVSLKYSLLPGCLCQKEEVGSRGVGRGCAAEGATGLEEHAFEVSFGALDPGHLLPAPRVLARGWLAGGWGHILTLGQLPLPGTQG